MILPSLIDYYDRLVADPEAEVVPFGYSLQKISFCVVLNPSGKLVEIADARVPVETTGGKQKLLARQVRVAGQAKPSGSGLNPCLLWDNAAYLLGWKADDPKPERTRASFEAYRDHHLDLRKEINDEGFDAVCRFLETWDSVAFEPDEATCAYLSSFGLFRLDGERGYVHQRRGVDGWYQRTLQAQPSGAEDSTEQHAQSLISGLPRTIARLHEPKIQGVWGAQSAGATIVSFNSEASESYGKKQGHNAPVSQEEAFKYCTVLKRLLADRDRVEQIGDTTAVWWVDSPEAKVAEDVMAKAAFARFFNTFDEDSEDHDAVAAEDAADRERLKTAIQKLTRGELPDLDGVDEGFHVLGLSPNAARLSVRFWWSGPLRDMLERVAQHHADARLLPVPPREQGRPMTIFRVLQATARHDGTPPKPDAKAIAHKLAGEVARSVFSGGPYPQSLLEAIVRRVRTDGVITHTRAAIVKACITRRRRVLAGPGGRFQEVPVSLNPDGPGPYQLGRLFAVLEKTQTDALPGTNRTIREGYFSSASATPAAVFPRLLRLSQHHLAKLDPGFKTNREKLIQEVCSHLETFPKQLKLEEQGLFQIGYYHQRQDLFTKKSETPVSEETSE
ncbi:type I-C CRISPR-associated protein Cas8c/Csd1 [Mucisphaera calidilacus]|uniref:CRISPR-associated protein (Cas_Csd1) n=1 Tax=Mucisphaera calidilacus TaxID=2527982 RepID=A0A518C077_9BACT|nr:type I-C CRISPR-associated protein Cas8c/Csd1 [Mucisphaera calidilacus]QDU72625.1 CRISPR-associated protein (Cas_Csd1) [Mucisphaera calidilacus]